MAQDAFSTAMTNRSIRTIRMELEFLSDSAIITPQALSSILYQLPEQSERHIPVSQPAAIEPAPYSPPATQLSNVSLNERAPENNNYSGPGNNNYQPPADYSNPAPPPSYSSAPPVLSLASALYAYTPTDAGDLALLPNDRIQVLEHMNNDWWRGRNERTQVEGIFPRTYVNVFEEKPAIHSPQPTNYGNVPLEVAESGSNNNGEDKKPNKLEQGGKKFGKKMGNAAIFGAGATIGSNIVNGIF